MPNDDTVGKGGWGGENVSKSDGAILECSLTGKNILKHAKIIGHSQSYANSALLIEAAWRDVGQMIAKL